MTKLSFFTSHSRHARTTFKRDSSFLWLPLSLEIAFTFVICISSYIWARGSACAQPSCLHSLKSKNRNNKFIFLIYIYIFTATTSYKYIIIYIKVPNKLIVYNYFCFYQKCHNIFTNLKKTIQFFLFYL